MEGYLWLYIFLLAVLPWWWRINHPSCLFPEWCSAVLLNTTASLNLNVRSPSAAAQDKANQHQMPPRWTYCLALESLTLSLLLINIIQPNPRVHFSQTTVKPSQGPCQPSEARVGRGWVGDGHIRSTACQATLPNQRVLPSAQLLCDASIGSGALSVSTCTETHQYGIIDTDLEWNLLVFQRPQESEERCDHSPTDCISHPSLFTLTSRRAKLGLTDFTSFGTKTLSLTTESTNGNPGPTKKKHLACVTDMPTNTFTPNKNPNFPPSFLSVHITGGEGKMVCSCFPPAPSNYSNILPFSFLRKGTKKSAQISKANVIKQ